MLHQRIKVSGIWIGVGSVLMGVCSTAPAREPLSFTNEALERGVGFTLGNLYTQVGAGLGLLDLDNDGDLDIIIAGGVNGEIGVYENDGTGKFTDRSATSGIAPMPRASGISAADYDNDGDLDIHIPGWFVPSRLYRNDGHFRFIDVAHEAGVDVNAPSMAASWGDYDMDGNIDLYACIRTFTDNVEIENKLYHNNGDGTFTDVAVQLGVEAPGDPSCLPTFFDYDRDGDDDLYIGTDKGSASGRFLHNRLYRNESDGTFTDVTFAARAEAWIFCMGIAVGDINFDGFFDLYLTNVPRGNKLFVYNGVSAYDNMTRQAGVGSHITGWGTVFADFDNDTNLDIYVCDMQGPNRLYRGSSLWPLIDEAPLANVDLEQDSFCVAVGDIDGDHDLDMLVGNTDQRVNLYINNSPALENNNWIRFNAVGNNANRFAVGTVVELTSAGKTQLREVRSGVNYKAQEEYTMHFGLADAQSIEQIRVIFTGRDIRTLTNAPLNHTWTLYPSARLGDPNGNGTIEHEELLAAINARTGPGVPIEEGMEIFDMDGDFDIDNDDLIQIRLKMIN